MVQVREIARDVIDFATEGHFKRGHLASHVLDVNGNGHYALRERERGNSFVLAS